MARGPPPLASRTFAAAPAPEGGLTGAPDGAFGAAASVAPPRRTLAQRILGGRPAGIAAAAAVAGVAYPLGRVEPLVGGPVLALAIGIAVSGALRPGERLGPGLAFTARYVLQAAIVILGGTLSLSQVARVGRASLPVMLGTLAAALLTALVFARLLRVPGRLRTLIGVGTGICGASAIAAVSGIIGAAESEIAYSVSTIFAFNLVAVVLFPVLGHALGLSQRAFGLWSGTAVNDTSSVLAAAYAYGRPAGATAVVVKLTRTTMIVPVALGLALTHLRRRRADGLRWTGIVPWFLVWFALASTADTAGLFGPSVRPALGEAALALTTLALAAVGLSTRMGDVRRAGLRPLLFGALVWAAVAGTSLVLQRLTGSW